MKIDLEKAGDDVLQILKDELAQWATFGAEAEAELASVSRKVAKYWATAYAEDLGPDERDRAERLLRHAEAELEIVVAEYTIDAARQAKARAKQVLRLVGRIGLNILKAAV